MSILEMFFIGGIAASMLSFIGMMIFSLNYFIQRKKLNQLPKKKFKNKKKNKDLARRQNELQKKKKRSIMLVILFMIFAMTFSGTSAYISYYQSMHLTTDDSDSVVRGYYLLRDFEGQLILARDQGEDEEKLQQNIRYLATAMASYGTQKASIVNSQEGQLSLNRYYNAVKQLGMNAITQTNNLYGNPDLVEEFLRDILKVQAHERIVFEYYRVNENTFAEKKQ